MFCNLCYNANRVNYDKHNLRDFAGNTICPYLLSIKCFTCGISGHTPKYCKNVFKRPVETSIQKPETQYKTVKAVVKIAANSFMCLDVNDENLCDDEYKYLNPDNIVWGKGFRDTLNVKWGDRD